jgi:hypothetical protein
VYVVKQGVYNPFTLGGTIIVNGVVASSHSDWFLDSVFEAMGVTHWLPAAYQLILLPARVLYTVVGKDAYIRPLRHPPWRPVCRHRCHPLCSRGGSFHSDSHQGFTQVSISPSAFSGAKLPCTLELRTGPTC